MVNLYLTCGIPASGKSTFVKNHILKHCKLSNTTYISRDMIRFTLLNPQDEYFAKETQVFKTFVNQINEAIANGKDVYADATFLNESSRNKLLDKINLDNVNIIPINFLEDIEICLERNEKRKGRAKVPRGTIRRMLGQFVPAMSIEKYNYDKILWVKNGEFINE